MNSRTVRTPIGLLELSANERGVSAVRFAKNAINEKPTDAKTKALLTKAERQLQEYFAGNIDHFTVPLALEGTAFQKRVWKELCAVQAGKTVSYAQLAKKSGHARAMRAVGSAMAKNPVCILVPCHRVVPSNGGIGNYGGGVAKKKWLLDHERANN